MRQNFLLRQRQQRKIAAKQQSFNILLPTEMAREMTNSEKIEKHVLGMLHNNHFNVFSDALAFLELTQVSQ